MENQHRKIKGYRELTQDEIDLMNEIKEKGVELGELIDKVNSINSCLSGEEGVNLADASRWCSVARTNLQQGLMALTRAVAKPGFF